MGETTIDSKTLMSPIGGQEEDLDDTRPMRRRWNDDYSSRPPTPKVEVPIGVIVTVFIYLIGQLAGSIWWAATLQSDVRYQQQENFKLWQKIETIELQMHKYREEAITRQGGREVRDRSINQE